ncbi:hypothetical protein ACWD4G_28550 [Streptomyces sp. NPDC002643]
MASETGVGTTALLCGQPFRPPATVGVLALTGRFPAAVPAGEESVVGTVEATSRTAVRGLAAPVAEVFLVRDGRVVTLPVARDLIGVPWDAAPGESRRLTGEATLVSCDPDVGPLPPGAYDLYARVVIIPDGGAPVESFGGPWPLEVR